MKYIAVLAMMASLAACGGELNPAGTSSGIAASEDETVNSNGAAGPDGGADDRDPSVDPTPPENGAVRYIFNDDERIIANLLEFDATQNELIVNNVPFDSDDQRYVLTGDTLNGIPVFESKTTGTTGLRKYFAIRSVSATGKSQAIVVATNDYRSAGYAGASAQRLDPETVNLPAEGQYLYTGDYAGIRVVRDDAAVDDGLINAVTGDAEIIVDIEDFDVNGAVEAQIINRQFRELDGTLIGADPDVIILATTPIDFENRAISGDDLFLGADPINGRFEAVFANDDGSEITGTVQIGGLESTRELGVFTTTRQPE